MALTYRHIQNMSEAAALEPHWGYADRAVPCTNDAGSCAYLDVVYAAHDRGMTYTAVLWLTIGGILFLWALSRRVFPARTRTDDLLTAALSPNGHQPPSRTKTNTLTRLRLATLSLLRQRLLPTTPLPTLFGRTATRLQLLTLAILTAYLTLWSFLGITYATWITPIKNTSPQIHNTRTSLGPWADRVGVLAYALTPLSILLASRESLLSLLTGIPYTSFLFLHRWTGYIILVQALLHTLGWVLVEAWLYRPQPTVWQAYAAQEYAVWGFVALGLLVLMVVLSLGVVVRGVTGYEVFRKVHYVLAMVYIGALIGHWKQLQCFLVPGLVLWAVDRGLRLVRMGLLHYGYWGQGKGWGFRAVEAGAKVWKGEGGLGDVVRLEFEHAHKPWAVGQHFFLCFVEGSIWQSHPFTPLSLPVADDVGRVKHAYVFRAKAGETKRIAEVLARKTAEEKAPTTPVILQGPYGEDMVEGLTQDVNVLCVAGGTGITYVLPVLLRLVRERPNPGRRMELVWAVKRKQDLEWVEPELDELRRLGVAHGLEIRTFVTAEPVFVAATKEVQVIGEKGRAETDDESGSVQDAFSINGDHRPDVTAVVGQFVGEVAKGSTRVFGSGPPGMIVDLRAAVAKNNSGGRVWKGEERFDVQLLCDDRLE